jgi:hypothetical protein
MRQHDFIIKPGQQLELELALFLAKRFNPEEIENAVKHGAKLRFSLITPWPKPKKPKCEIVVDPAVLAELQSLVPRPDALEARIAELSGPQILKIGAMLGIPMLRTAKLEGLRARLFGSLRSETVWKGISGQISANEVPPGADGSSSPLSSQT